MITGHHLHKHQKRSNVHFARDCRRESTMYNYRRISNIAEEEGLLQEMLNLQSQIRAQREKDRIAKTTRREKYTKMFEPVTKSLERLVTPAPPATNNLVDLTDVIPEHVNVPLEPMKEEKDEFEEMQEPGELYKEALNNVPIRRRDDGMLGLNPEKHSIGDYIYEVVGNTLKVHHDHEQKHFEIHDLELWKLLLVKNPQYIGLKLKDEQKRYLPFVEEFKDIVDQLNLVASSGHRGFKNRVKYKMLMEMRGGSGFLFSVQPPTTLVVPSDNLGLMRALYQALAELRAGNTSMRNIVVPLAAEAKRKKILPENLLSADEETWVYA